MWVCICVTVYVCVFSLPRFGKKYQSFLNYALANFQNSMWFVFYCTFYFSYCELFIVFLYRVFLLYPRPTAHFLHVNLSYFTNPASWLPHWNKACLVLNKINIKSGVSFEEAALLTMATDRSPSIIIWVSDVRVVLVDRSRVACRLYVQVLADVRPSRDHQKPIQATDRPTDCDWQRRKDYRPGWRGSGEEDSGNGVGNGQLLTGRWAKTKLGMG